MKTKKRLLALLLTIVMAAGIFTGCTKTDTATDSKKEIVTESAETREITDMAGRSVTLPAEINSAFSANTVSAIFLYMTAPDKLLGWNYELNDIEKSVIPEKYQSLPNFGMGDAISYENVIAANPDVAVVCGKINDALVTDCDTLSEQLGIPVVAVDSEFANSAEAFCFLGTVLGVEEHAEELAAYTEQIFADAEALSAIPEEKKARVYFGNGEDSLETIPDGSFHAKMLDMVNVINVADLEVGDGSRVQISSEQLLAWDPDVILVNGEPKASLSGSSAAKAIMDNPDYSSLKAVKDGKVYGTPNAPFSWVDRPAGPNRLIGLRWLSALIYPDYTDFDLNEEIHTFFELFYHVDVTDEKIKSLLNGTL